MLKFFKLTVLKGKNSDQRKTKDLQGDTSDSTVCVLLDDPFCNVP